MVQPTGLTRDPGPFDATLKCCTYFPFVPNFSLGAMLESKNSQAALRIQAAQIKGVLLPSGLFAAPEHEQRILDIGGDGFGQHRELLCPFFDTARLGCSVWQYRPGVCTTYFCKSERGQDGLEFWGEVETYLNIFEWTLATEALARAGYDEQMGDISEAVMLTEEIGPERDGLLRQAWGSWHLRKHELLIACFEQAKRVSADELTALMGDDALALEESIKHQSSHWGDAK
jgi:Fe-S-cluster containining protein